MGIAGLHTLLKSIQKPCHLRKFKGQTLGVDAYGWLHRGTVACAIDLALGRDTKKHIEFVLNRVRMLTHFGVIPYLVFDGGMLPSKAETETSRAARREESKNAGMRLYHAGRVVQAQQELQKAVDVTPYMARLLIEELKKLQIQYVVAPYEADSQLVYLEKQGIINGIISEDSDMLVFGAKRLLSKLDQHGECVEINRGDFTACRDISLIGWSDENFRQMCILSGCDYLANIPGLGLKTAYRYIRKCKSAERAVKMVQFDGKSRVPPGYLEDFKRAELTFLYQRVFCPNARKLTTLLPLPPDAMEEDMPFIGEDMDAEVAIGIACGDLDPMTKEAIEIQQSYPERARMVLSRRQTLPSATEKRPTNRITSFFTPKRIPLGELDPNSLTPSPSQQHVLEENSNSSWEASPVPAPNGMRPSLTSTSTPRPLRTSVPSQNNQRESFLARAAAAPRPPPIKRQRLCSDADESAHVGTATEKKSRFFASNSAEKRVNTQKKQVKKAKKPEFGVFSDDSVENIMTQLSDKVTSTSGSAETKPTTSEEFTEQTKAPQNEEAVEMQEHPAIEVGGTPPDEPVQSTTPSETSPSVDVDSDPTLFNKVVEYHVERHNLKLRERYGYHITEGESSTTSRSAERMKRSLPHEECHYRPRTMPRNTPLQRLGQAAVTRSKSLNSLQMKKFETDRVEAGYDSEGTVRQPLQSKGSEDLIVPDSQDEDDDEEHHQPVKSETFDVRKFVFAPP